ncbi:MAG: AbrB/MazE/SpoVT family DNA-binding domain-containing protein [Candidatus Lokiarchaeota archaeon]|nr:AbrB/MazE/SpoVT family DNA-binding domain-containing protein [Candidatus Lokiarchaeota archaeon]
MTIVKVGKHGEIVIKKRFRKSYGISPGQEVIEFDAGDHIAIIPISPDALDSLRGKYNWEKTSDEYKEVVIELALKEVKEKY